jgi:hypothetical protein
MQPYFEASLGADTAGRLTLKSLDDVFRISLDSETLDLDLRMATQLAFTGPHIIGDSRLKEALTRIFPLPMLSPGNLNYV